MKGCAMPNYPSYKRIKFELRDMETGFFVEFEIPFSHENYAAVVAFPGSACIKLLK